MNLKIPKRMKISTELLQIPGLKPGIGSKAEVLDLETCWARTFYIEGRDIATLTLIPNLGFYLGAEQHYSNINFHTGPK